MPQFTNLTSIPDVDRRVTERVRSELIGRGKWTVKPDATGVDGLITGDIVAITVAPAAFNNQQQAIRYALILTARVEFKDMKANKVLWSNPSMQYQGRVRRDDRHAHARCERVLRSGRQRARTHGVRICARGRERHPRSLLMPSATPAQVRAAIARRALDPVYLIVGDDDTEMARLASDLGTVVEDELRAFNVERLYGGDKGVSAAAIVESCRLLPMMSDRRVVVVLRGERCSSRSAEAGRPRRSTRRMAASRRAISMRWTTI